jgi:hypothetical protein
MMVAVAIVALMLWGVTCWWPQWQRQRVALLRRAGRHAGVALSFRQAAGRMPAHARVRTAYIAEREFGCRYNYGPDAVGLEPSEVAREYLRRAAAHERDALAYRRAARHPFAGAPRLGPPLDPFDYDYDGR